jgi:hypothetical protein
VLVKEIKGQVPPLPRYRPSQAETQQLDWVYQSGRRDGSDFVLDFLTTTEEVAIDD